MSKKNSLISSYGVNNQNSANNKNLIPHPKNAIQIRNQNVSYKKWRNNDIRINQQYFSENEKCNYKINIPNSINEKTNFLHKRNIIISNLMENMDNENY